MLKIYAKERISIFDLGTLTSRDRTDRQEHLIDRTTLITELTGTLLVLLFNLAGILLMRGRTSIGCLLKPLGRPYVRYSLSSPPRPSTVRPIDQACLLIGLCPNDRNAPQYRAAKLITSVRPSTKTRLKAQVESRLNQLCDLRPTRLFLNSGATADIQIPPLRAAGLLTWQAGLAQSPGIDLRHDVAEPGHPRTPPGIIALIR